MPEEATWDTQIDAAAAPPPTGEIPEQAEAPTTDTPPTADVNEPETQIEQPVESTDEPPREGEPEAERTTQDEAPKADAKAEAAPEDTQPDDPEELRALPTPAARRWARTRHREARVVDDYLDLEKPIRSVATRLYEKSQSRFGELVTDIFELYGDHYVQQKYGVKPEELQSRLQTPTDASHDQPADDPNYDPLEDPLVPEHEKQLVREARQAREEAAALKAQMEQVTGKVSTFEQKEQEREREAHQQKVQAISQELRSSVMSVIPEVVEKEYGLEVSDRDLPVIRGLKRAASLILNSEVIPAFEEDPENLKVVNRAVSYAERLERENAFREEDNLKVRVRSSLAKVREREEVRAILEAIEAVGNLKAEAVGARGRKSPPAPVSTVPGSGISPHQPATWDEAEAQASAAR